jgi:hypothetical protein
LVIPTYKLAKIPLVIPTSRNVNDEKYRTPFIPANCCRKKSDPPINATAYTLKNIFHIMKKITIIQREVTNVYR